MFVESLDIKEFRGIKSFKAPIQLSNFTVLIGRNNSGKSAILEALSLLPDPFIQNYFSGSNRISYIKNLHQPPSIKRLLYLYAGTSILEYSIQGKTIKFEINERQIECYFNGKSKSPVSDLVQMYHYNNDTLPHMVLFIPDTTSILSDLEDKMKILKEEITKKGFHIDLAKFLNECVNDEYSEIVFLEPISLRKIYSNNKVYIQLRDLGSGAEKVIKIMSLLGVLNPELVIIDDFESGLHPTLINLFLKWLKEHKWQTIISTHSIDVLYNLAEIKPEDTTIIQLSKSSEDIISHKVLALDELEDILNANTDPRLLVDALDL